MCGRDCVCVALIIECIRRHVFRVLLEKGNDVALAAMKVRNNSNTIGFSKGMGLQVRIRGRRKWERILAHLLSCYPCTCSRMPFGDQETQGMASTKGNTGQESPLLADKPLIILDVVRVGQ